MTRPPGFPGLDRRRFLQGAIYAALVAPFGSRQTEAAGGGTRVPRIGVLGDSNPVGWFVRTAAADIECRWADEHRQPLPDLAAELVRLDVDVIVAIGAEAAQAAMDITRTVPIVFVAAGNPVRAGLVGDVRRPGANVTGVTVVSGVEMSAAKLDVLEGLVSGLKRLAVLGNPGNPSHGAAMRDALEAAAARGVEVSPVTAAKRGDLEDAFATMARERAAVVLSDVVFATEASRLASLASAAQLPIVYESKSFVEAGGLMAIHADGGAVIERTVAMVQRILRGEKPAAIPVEQLTRLELTVNAGAARELGLTLPRSLLARADSVIGARA
jgi:putative tryptophan/tyrosine transport system substrate-binding protein